MDTSLTTYNIYIIIPFMISIKDARIGIGPKNEERVAEAHTDSVIAEYADRRASIAGSKWQKILGYGSLNAGVIALVASATLPISAPTALGILTVSGALAAGVG